MRTKIRLRRLIVLSVICTLVFGFLGFASSAKSEKLVTLTMWHNGGESWQLIFEDLASDFAKQEPNIKVRVYTQPTVGYGDKLMSAFISGLVPDICTNSHDYALELEQKYAAWLDMGKYAKDWPEYKLIPQPLLRSITYNGKLYAVPFSDTPLALYIRKSWMKNVGWDNPYPYINDWGELLELAKKFTFEDPDGNGKDDTWGYEMFGSLSRNYACVQFEYMMNAAGVELVEDGKLNFNTDIGRFVLGRMQDYVFKYKVVPSDTATYTHVEFYRDTKAGIVGIGRLGSWNIPPFDEALKCDYFACPYPPVKAGGTALQSSIYDVLQIPITGKQPQETLKWIRFLMGKEAQTKLFVSVGLAYRPDLDWPTLIKNDREGYFRTAKFNPIYVITDPGWTYGARAKLTEHIQKCLVDLKADPAKELAAAEKEIAETFYKK